MGRVVFFDQNICCEYSKLKSRLSETVLLHAQIQRGDGRSGPPPEKSQNIGFLSNTGPDPLKNHKASKPEFNVGPSLARQRNAI